jgi:hypothetical protein
MSGDNFATYIQRERERLGAEREAVITQQRELDKRLADINKDFQAIEAYEAAKSGKSVALQGTRRRSEGQRQARRGSRREGILELLRQAGAGLSRGELLERLGLKGDKSGEMSVSNALTALTKGNHVRRQSGKYHHP